MIISLYFVLGKNKTGSHKQISFHSLNICYEKGEISYLWKLYNINEPYSNFIQKLTSVTDQIAPCKTKRVKVKFKKSRLPLDQKNYKKACYKVKLLKKEKLLWNKTYCCEKP